MGEMKVTIKFDQDDLDSIMEGLNAMADEVQYLREVLEGLRENAAKVVGDGEEVH